MRHTPIDNMHRAMRAERWIVPCALLFACGGASPPPPAQRPSSDAYPGDCSLVAIEEVPAQEGQQGDAMSLVARYRPGQSQDRGGPLGLRFQIARSREHDLRLHLQSHPNVICQPRGAEGRLELDVPAFEGQRGTAVP